MEETTEELISRLNIKLETPPIADKDLANTSCIIIRHGYSMYNFLDSEISQQYGADSEQKLALKGDPTLMDPGLHPIGIR